MPKPNQANSESKVEWSFANVWIATGKEIIHRSKPFAAQVCTQLRVKQEMECCRCLQLFVLVDQTAKSTGDSFLVDHNSDRHNCKIPYLLGVEKCIHCSQANGHGKVGHLIRLQRKRHEAHRKTCRQFNLEIKLH